MPELKPCPFCGKKAIVKLNCWGRYVVGCTDMFCLGWIYNQEEFKNKEEALQVWNTRVGEENG